VSQERAERLARGPKGETGSQGEPGQAGLSRSLRQSLAFMFVFAVALSVLALFWINHEVHVGQAADRAAYTQEQAAARRAAETLERKLCKTFGELAANQPPAGNPATNPSRRYDQDNHAILAQISPDLDCPGQP
jgi:hypothetical protein